MSHTFRTLSIDMAMRLSRVLRATRAAGAAVKVSSFASPSVVKTPLSFFHLCTLGVQMCVDLSGSANVCGCGVAWHTCVSPLVAPSLGILACSCHRIAHTRPSLTVIVLWPRLLMTLGCNCAAGGLLGLVQVSVSIGSTLPCASTNKFIHTHAHNPTCGS